jgi:hypothetical protein
MVWKRARRLWRTVLPIALCFLLSFDNVLPSARAQEQPRISRIQVVVTGGEGAVSRTRVPVSSEPVVRVEDDNHRPLAGATVVFALPVSGTTGEFGNGAKTLTVQTDQSGLATARGLRAGDVPGRLQILVTASYRGFTATELINQTIAAPAGAKVSQTTVSNRGGKWKWVLLGIVAAGGIGAGVYFGTRGSKPAPISISAGTVSFGNPR